MRHAWTLAITTVGLHAAALAQPFAQGLGDNAVRFFESREAFASAPPSFAIHHPPRHEIPVTDFAITPEFSSSDDRHIVRIKVPPGSSLYGLGTADGPFLRNGFDSHGEAVTHPWVLAVRPDGSSFGALADTTWGVAADLRQDIIFSSAAPTLAVMVITGPDPQSVVVAMSKITGWIEMPPRWSLGFGLSAPRTEDGIRAAASWCKGQTLGASWLHSQVTPSNFEPPAADPGKPIPLVGQLDELGLHLVVDSEPYVQRFPESNLAKALQDGSLWALTKDGQPVQGMNDTSGPELGAAGLLPDFGRDAARSAWSAWTNRLATAGVRGVIVGPLITIRSTFETAMDSSLGGSGTFAQYAPLFARFVLDATRQGFVDSRANTRPFIASWLNPLSAQRSSAAFTAYGEQTSLQNTLTLQLSGQAFTVGNIGSLASTGRPEVDMTTDIATLLPMVTGWEHISDPKFPVSPARIAHLKSALDRRSRLIPYYYTLCFNAFFQSEPILRPVFFADPTDPALRSIDSMLMIGADLLAIPHATDGSKPPVPLKGKWRPVTFGVGDDAGLPDLYLRPGAILPLAPAGQPAGNPTLDTLTLVINLDDSGSARGELYEDSGDGTEFTHNQCRRMAYRATTSDGAIFIRLATLDGGLPIPKRKLDVRILTDADELTATGSERGTIKIDLPKKEP